jgi:FKBP-type peptidyl-prolyl cis-trans isomerase
MRCTLQYTKLIILLFGMQLFATELHAQALALKNPADGEPSDAAKTLNPDDFGQMLSYAIGYSTGMRIQKSAPKIHLDKVFLKRGFQDYYYHKGTASNKSVTKPKVPLVAPEEAKTILDDYHKQELALAPKTVDQWEAQRPENKRLSDIYLKKIAKKTGVLADARGFYYEVIKDASGPKAKITDLVEFHYRALNSDGIEVQSSFEFGRPEQYPVFESDHLGWDYALTSMSVGSKWRVYMPSEMGFDNMGRLPHLLPGAAMIFELELLRIIPHPRDLATLKLK